MTKFITKQIVLPVLCALATSTFTVQPLHSMEIIKPLAVVSAIGAAGYGLYKVVHKKANDFLDDRIVDESLIAINLATKSVSSLTEEDLPKKAALLQMSLTILDVLDAKSNDMTLSPDHRTAIKDAIKYGNNFLSRALITTALNNIYDRRPSLKNHVLRYPFTIHLLGFDYTIQLQEQEIERIIINNVLLTTKPNHECTAQEIAEKEAMQKHNLADKIKAKIATDPSKTSTDLTILNIACVLIALRGKLV